MPGGLNTTACCPALISPSSDPPADMPRGEIAQVVYSVLEKITPASTTTTTAPCPRGWNLLPVGREAQVGEWKPKIAGAILGATQIGLAENMVNHGREPPSVALPGLVLGILLQLSWE
jgi:hypothetical protein